MGLFMLIGYYALSNARIAQQNKVVDKSLKTAHQIQGHHYLHWVMELEHLKQKKVSKSVTQEIQKDLNRLTVIASRFSKIGSLPKLEELNIVNVLDSIKYIVQKNHPIFSIKLYAKTKLVQAKINKDLFEWVIEKYPLKTL